MASSPSALRSLDTVVTTALALISQLESTITTLTSSPTPSQPPTQQPPPPTNPLTLSRDACTLIHTHTTKLSLLIISNPFTPTAVTTVLRELLSGPIPALASSIELCTPARYTATIRDELAWRATRVLRELGNLIGKVPKDGKILTEEGKEGGKGSLALTGVLWDACEEVGRFVEKGVEGGLKGKVEEWKGEVGDVGEELKEWGEEEEEEEDDDDDEVEEVTKGVDNMGLEGEEEDSAQAMLDEWMGGQKTIPKDDPDKIRERLEVCLKKLRLVTLLYTATTKRRLKLLGKAPLEEGVAKRVDEVMVVLKRIPDRFSDVAAAFYELDAEEIDRTMEECYADAIKASDLLMLSWNGESDAFSEWAVKFQAEIKKS